MERKVPFVKCSPAEYDIFLWHQHLSRHVEPLDHGLAVVVTSRVFFRASGISLANIALTVIVSHFGQPIMTVESGALKFSPKDIKKRYTDDYAIFVGGQKISVGFEGKSLSIEGYGGWLPKYMYVKIEPTT